MVNTIMNVIGVRATSRRFDSGKAVIAVSTTLMKVPVAGVQDGVGVAPQDAFVSEHELVGDQVDVAWKPGDALHDRPLARQGERQDVRQRIEAGHADQHQQQVVEHVERLQAHPPARHHRPVPATRLTTTPAVTIPAKLMTLLKNPTAVAISHSRFCRPRR